MCKATSLAMLGRITQAQALFGKAWSLDAKAASAYTQDDAGLRRMPDAPAIEFVAEFGRITGGDWRGYSRRVAVLDGYIGDDKSPPSDLELA